MIRAGYEVVLVGGTPTVELETQISREQDSGKENLTQRIQLHATRQNIGGLRWWFSCPDCGRRVDKLYLPAEKRYFGCRHCYDLTYQSVQEHDKRVDFFRNNPEALLAALETPYVKLSTLGLALKAIR